MSRDISLEGRPPRIHPSAATPSHKLAGFCILDFNEGTRSWLTLSVFSVRFLQDFLSPEYAPCCNFDSSIGLEGPLPKNGTVKNGLC